MRKSIVWLGALPFVAMTTQGCLIIGLRHAIHHSSVHGSSGSVVHATGPTVTEKRSVGTFTNLNVASAFEVDVVVGGATSVSVEAPKAAMSHIVTSVRGDTLEVGISGSINIDGPLRLHVTTPNLSAIDMSGACHGSLTGVDAKKFEVKLSGSARLTVSGTATDLEADISGASALDWPNLNLNSLRINQSGSAQSTISGHAANASFEASGASNVNAQSFQADTVEAIAEGASHIEFDANTKIEAKASGASSIRYGGAASQISSSTSGAGSIGHR